jgi:hypothetical protein
MPRQTAQQNLDDKKWAAATAFVAAWNDWKNAYREPGYWSSIESQEKWRLLKKAERAFEKIRMK